MLIASIKNFGIASILCLQGRIVQGETEALRKAVDSQAGARVLILDLAGVSIIDAGGLGLLLELREQTRAKGIDFKLMNLRRPVRRLLEITRLNSVFAVTSSEEVFAQARWALQASLTDLAPCA